MSSRKKSLGIFLKVTSWNTQHRQQQQWHWSEKAPRGSRRGASICAAWHFHTLRIFHLFMCACKHTHSYIHVARACLCVGKLLAFSLWQRNFTTTLARAGEKNALRSHKSLRWKLVYNNLLICQGFFASWRTKGTDFRAESTVNRCSFAEEQILSGIRRQHFVAKRFLGCLLLACLLSVSALSLIQPIVNVLMSFDIRNSQNLM